jgi:hypothetical protein
VRNPVSKPASVLLPEPDTLVMRLVVGRYLSRARELGIENPKTGGLNVLQRFGGSLDLGCRVVLAGLKLKQLVLIPALAKPFD